MTDYAAEMEAALQNLLGKPSEPFTGPEEPEEVRLVREAMHCAKTGEATHWPAVAGILAEEVERLQAQVQEHEQLKSEVRRLRQQNSDQGWELEARREAYYHERGRNTW